LFVSPFSCFNYARSKEIAGHKRRRPDYTQEDASDVGADESAAGGTGVIFAAAAFAAAALAAASAAAFFFASAAAAASAKFLSTVAASTG